MRNGGLRAIYSLLYFKMQRLCNVTDPANGWSFIMIFSLQVGRSTSITRPQSSLADGRRYVTDGGRLAQRPS
jgi:hypothetical protein